MDPNFVAIEFLCPVCNTLPLKDAVLAEDGFVYDRECVEPYLHFLRSPMTRLTIGKTMIASPVVNSTIKKLATCDGLDPAYLKKKETAERAYCVEEMVDLARLYLFEEEHQRECDRDESNFYHVTRIVAENDALGRVYLGMCLICGVGVEKHFAEGFELLVDAAAKDPCEAKDLALYTLGMCYSKGAWGFRRNEIKGAKYLDKVESSPRSFVSAYWNEEDEDPGGVRLFDDVTATTMTSMTVDSLSLECTRSNLAAGLPCIGSMSKELFTFLEES